MNKFINRSIASLLSATLLLNPAFASGMPSSQFTTASTISQAASFNHEAVTPFLRFALRPIEVSKEFLSATAVPLRQTVVRWAPGISAAITGTLLFFWASVLYSGQSVATYIHAPSLQMALVVVSTMVAVPYALLGVGNLAWIQNSNSRGARILFDLGLIRHTFTQSSVMNDVTLKQDPPQRVVNIGPLRLTTALSVTSTIEPNNNGHEGIILTRTDTQMKLSIEKIDIGMESYLKIGNRTYHVLEHEIDLDAMLHDGLFWMGNRQFVDFYTPQRVFREKPGPAPALAPFPANPRLQPSLVPSPIPPSERQGMIERLRGLIPTLIIEDEIGAPILQPHERMKLLHYAAVAGGQPVLSSGKLDDHKREVEEYFIAMDAIELMLGDPKTRRARFNQETESIALRLADYLTMVHYGFDEQREADLVSKFGDLLATGDPEKLRQVNWYFNQPEIPGKGRAIQIKPLPAPEQVAMVNITRADELQQYSILHEESLESFVDGMDDSYQTHVVAILPAGGAASRFGGVPKANYKVVKIQLKDGSPARYLSFMQVKRGMVQGESNSIPLWATASHVSERMVREIFSDLRPIDRIITQEVSHRFRHGTVQPLQFGNGQLSIAPGVGHASNITQILLNKELMIAALRERKYIFTIGNIDNLGQRVRKRIIKTMLKSALEGKPLTAIGEITAKHDGDSGGIPALVTYMSGLRKTIEIDLREQTEYQKIPADNPRHVDESQYLYFNPANYNVYFLALLSLIDIVSPQELSMKPDQLADLAISRLDQMTQEGLVTRYRKLIDNLPTYLISRSADDPSRPGEKLDADQFEQMMQNYLFRLLPGHKLFVIGKREGPDNSFTPVKTPAETAYRQADWKKILEGGPMQVDGAPLSEYGQVVLMGKEEIDRANIHMHMHDVLKSAARPVEALIERIQVVTSEQEREELVRDLERLMFDEDVNVRDVARFALGRYLGVDIQGMLEWENKPDEVAKIISKEEDRNRQSLMVAIVMSVIKKETTKAKPSLLRSALTVQKKLFPDGDPTDLKNSASRQNSVLGRDGLLGYWEYYSGAVHVYEYSSKLSAWLEGLQDVGILVTRTRAYIEHALFDPATHEGWSDRFRDIRVALSGPLVSLGIALTFLAGLTTMILPSMPSWTHLLAEAQLVGLEVIGASLIAIYVVPPFVLHTITLWRSMSASLQSQATVLVAA